MMRATSSSKQTAGGSKGTTAGTMGGLGEVLPQFPYAPVPGEDIETQFNEDFFNMGAAKEQFRLESTMCVESAAFQGIMALLIIGNAIVIGLETDMPSWPHWDLVEGGFLTIFTGELVLRFWSLGCKGFFTCRRDLLWNLFDLIVVSLGVLDTIAGLVHPEVHSGNRKNSGVTTIFRIIRLLRILRIFKIIRFLKELYLLAYGLAEAAQAIFWVTILMSFVLYVCSILLVRSIGHPPEGDPHSAFLTEKFGNVPRSMFSLFVLMASPNLPDYAVEQGLLQAHPQLACFLIVFTIFGSFGMIALLTGVISESMFEKNQLRIEEERAEREIVRKTVQERCRAIFKTLTLNEEGQASAEDINHVLPVVCRLFDMAQVDYMREELFASVRMMDTDGNGVISEDEFLEALGRLSAGVRAVSLQEMLHQVSQIDGKLNKLQAEFARAKKHAASGATPGAAPNVANTARAMEKAVVWESETRKSEASLKQADRADLSEVRELVKEGFREVVEEFRAAPPGSPLQLQCSTCFGRFGGSEGLQRLTPASATAQPRPFLGSVGSSQMGEGPPLDSVPALPPLLAGGAELRDRLVEVMRSHTETLARVIALEAQALLLSLPKQCFLGDCPSPAAQARSLQGLLQEPIWDSARSHRAEDPCSSQRSEPGPGHPVTKAASDVLRPPTPNVGLGKDNSAGPLLDLRPLGFSAPARLASQVPGAAHVASAADAGTPKPTARLGPPMRPDPRSPPGPGQAGLADLRELLCADWPYRAGDP